MEQNLIFIPQLDFLSPSLCPKQQQACFKIYKLSPSNITPQLLKIKQQMFCGHCKCLQGSTGIRDLQGHSIFMGNTCNVIRNPYNFYSKKENSCLNYILQGCKWDTGNSCSFLGGKHLQCEKWRQGAFHAILELISSQLWVLSTK